MKRIIIFSIIFTLFFSLGLTATAAEPMTHNANPSTEETTQDMSAPRLMVTSYSLDTDTFSPETTSTLKIVFKNFSDTKSLRNIKLSLADESGEIEIQGMGTEFVSRISPRGEYAWEVKLTPAHSAQTGKHSLRVTAEYEDIYFSSFSASDILSLTVMQSVSLDTSGIALPDTIVEGETNTMTISLMNTGKTPISNCKLTFASDTLENGGTAFVGDIPVGESASTNLNYKQPIGKLGDVTARVEVSYEDAFGATKTQSCSLSSVAEKKVELAEITDENDKNKNSLWWLFLLTGLLSGGGLGYGIPTAIRSKRQRKEDELRL